MLRGEWDGAQCFTEPEAGTDEASLKSTAIRDGDVYVINGDKVFVGRAPIGSQPFKYLYWTAVTDPKAPRYQNLGAFLIPGDLPGIHYTPLDLIGAEGPQKWEIFCENVRCPADRLIGVETQGWQVAQATLAVEHGGAGSILPRNRMIPRLIDYCQKTLRNGEPTSKDPRVQDILVQLYIEHHVGRLWGLRNYAMAQGQIPRVRYTGTQTSLHGKRFSPVQGKALMEILGPYCLLDDPELQVLAGQVEHQVRMGDVTHIGGTPETQQIMMSRGLGFAGLGPFATRAGAARR
jgi:alkylation response protein AidB-like acyl-CoA dehydrogenase